MHPATRGDITRYQVTRHILHSFFLFRHRPNQPSSENHHLAKSSLPHRQRDGLSPSASTPQMSRWNFICVVSGSKRVFVLARRDDLTVARIAALSAVSPPALVGSDGTEHAPNSSGLFEVPPGDYEVRRGTLPPCWSVEALGEHLVNNFVSLSASF